MCYHYPSQDAREEEDSVQRYNPKKDPYNNGLYILITLIILGLVVLMAVAQCSVASS